MSDPVELATAEKPVAVEVGRNVAANVEERGGVSVEPMSIEFRGPFSNARPRSSFTVTNSSNSRLAFRIKTNAPSLYLVRPNSGFLEPEEAVHVRVEIPKSRIAKLSVPSSKLKHGFMVLTKPVDAAKMDRHQVWGADKDETKVKKIRVVSFVSLDSGSSQGNQQMIRGQSAERYREQNAMEVQAENEEVKQEENQQLQELEREVKQLKHGMEHLESRIGTKIAAMSIAIFIIGHLFLYLIFGH